MVKKKNYSLFRNIMPAEANSAYVWWYSWLRIGQKCSIRNAIVNPVAINSNKPPVTKTCTAIIHAENETQIFFEPFDFITTILARHCYLHVVPWKLSLQFHFSEVFCIRTEVFYMRYRIGIWRKVLVTVINYEHSS